MRDVPVKTARAAAYARKSTAEHQRFSIENQLAAIGAYAGAHGLEIVRTYSDAGKSGLKVNNRQGLKQLLLDVQSGEAPYRAILVYDVSRWGRFQDTDESAYYEYACKRAGITVHYCAEQFTNDGTPLSAIVKGIKRAMAAEYSRELGVKVYAGQKNIAMRGFHMGSHPGYGLRRMLVDPSGKHKRILKRHERKNITSDRTVLVPGPPHELRVVRWIFHSFNHRGMWETAIARALNRRHIPSGRNIPWNFSMVYRILTNPKYAGESVWGRTAQRLGGGVRVVAPGAWIRSPVRSKPIVTKRSFDRAQQIRAQRHRGLTNEYIIGRLKLLLRKKGKLTDALIDADPSLPTGSGVSSHFDNKLTNAYRLAGFTPSKSCDWIELNRTLLKLRGQVVDQVCALLERRGDTVVSRIVGRNAALFINNTSTLYIILSRSRTQSWGAHYWCIRLDNGAKAGSALVIRMNSENKEVAARYFFPDIELIRSKQRRSEKALPELDAYRIKSLSALYGLI